MWLFVLSVLYHETSTMLRIMHLFLSHEDNVAQVKIHSDMDGYALGLSFSTIVLLFNSVKTMVFIIREDSRKIFLVRKTKLHIPLLICCDSNNDDTFFLDLRA